MSESGSGEPPVVLVTSADAIGTITLHRPEVRNAINGDLRRGPRTAMEDFEADPEVAVIVLTGTDPAFCAGLDLREVGRGNPDVIGGQTSGSTRPRQGRCHAGLGPDLAAGRRMAAGRGGVGHLQGRDRVQPC